MSMRTARAYLHSIIKAATNDGLSSQHNCDMNLFLKIKYKPLENTEV